MEVLSPISASASMVASCFLFECVVDPFLMSLDVPSSIAVLKLKINNSYYFINNFPPYV